MATLTDAERLEISEARALQGTTRRTISSGLEDILHNVLPVLDHGFIRVVDYMGDDSSVVQAARVSYGRGTRRVHQDQGLINYLMRHRHTTPFEMAEIKLHVKLPIFVARQWIRHRTASVNEYSARYSILDREFYVPEPQHLAAQSHHNRQGRENLLEGEEASFVLRLLREDAELAYEHYLTLLNQKDSGGQLDPTRLGLARELARMNLSVNFYTQWYWKVDLHNFMKFLHLRSDSHAQYEIRAYAKLLVSILEKWVPFTAQAFHEHTIGGMNLSAKAIDVLQQRLTGKKVRFEEAGLSRREWQELCDTFDI